MNTNNTKSVSDRATEGHSPRTPETLCFFSQSALTSRKIIAANSAVTINTPPIKNSIECPSSQPNELLICLLRHFIIERSKFRDDAQNNL